MSRPQVTITLGRSGRVVKKPAAISDGSQLYHALSGSKRSVRERLGSNVDNVSQSKSKRQRRDSSKWSPSSNDVDINKQIDARVGRDDLRYRLMRKKHMSRRTQSDSEKQNNIDLREKLTRTVRPLMNIDKQQHVPETRTTGLLRQIPPTRSADDLLQMDSLRKSNSAWTLDGLRTSRGLSPPRRMDELRHVPSFRSVDASSPTPSFVMKASVPLDAAKPVARIPPPSGIILKRSYTGIEPSTVSSLLQSLGLEKYAILFQAEEVDMTALKQMGDNDLKELGIPMGPRKKILLSVLPRSKRQP